MSDERDCVCGHVRDEHEDGPFFHKCTVDGCDCLDYEPVHNDDDA